jgi:hypothetical protein
LLSQAEVEAFYSSIPLAIPKVWNPSRKHFRVSLFDGRFVKLNHFENRLNEKDLRFYCYKLKPMHVYFSVLNWLFSERVGKNGEYVIDATKAVLNLLQIW